MKIYRTAIALTAFATVSPLAFGDIQSDVNALKTEVAALKSSVATLKIQVASDAMVIGELQHKTFYMSVSGNQTIFSGTNVIIRKDNAFAGGPNGLGNLIVGYDAMRTDGTPTLRGGSHNIIYGEQANYLSMNCLVGGYRNGIDANFGAILSGDNNAIHGSYGIIAGGYKNVIATTNGFIATGWANRLGWGTGTQGNCNFILSGYKNEAGFGTYNGILSGSGNVCYYQGSVFGTGVNNGVNSDWSFNSN